MPLLARDNSTLLPLDSTLIPPDLSVRTSGQAASAIHNTHRVVLASASVFLESVFMDSCPCEQMTIILPESFDNILDRFITWLYTGVVELRENDEVLKWNDLVELLGIGVENERIEKHEIKAPSKETDEGRFSVGPRMKSDNLLVKSLKALILNDSKEYPEKAFYDADIFTSDDDRFAAIDEDGKLGNPVKPISYNANSNVDSCVQCDLSTDEHEDDSTNDLVNEFVIVNKCDSNETNSSSSDFLDATMSPPVEKSSSQPLAGEVFDKSLHHNETVYQDCNEEVEDNKPEAGTIDEDSSDKLNFQKEIQSTDIEFSSNETNSKKKDDENIEDIGLDGSVDDNESVNFKEEKKDDEQEFDAIDGERDIRNESTSDVFIVIGSRGKKSNNIFEEDRFEDDSLSGNETENYEEEESYDDDPSWNESCSDFSDQSDDEVKVSKKADNSTLSIPLGDLTNINLSTVDTSVLGAWLSDSGPVKIPPRCLCKGTCVRNCSCKTAGAICTSRCSCKPSKCKLRAEAANKLAEGSPPFLRTGSMQSDAENASSDVGNINSNSPPPVTDCADVEDQSQVTPSCLSSTFFSSNSTIMSTTAKKKKKKLFTEAIGPQEM